MTPPDFQPTLIGPTVTVRPIAPGDWSELYAISSDPEVYVSTITGIRPAGTDPDIGRSLHQ
jgi:hypothetical protein